MEPSAPSIPRPCRPSHGRTTRPTSRRSLRIALAALTGTAKPIACASSEMRVLMPITAPQRSTSGPPELPGLIGASVWIIGSSEMPGSSRFIPLTIPRVIVWSSPIGLPIATTSSPTFTPAESPRRADGSGFPVSARSRAMSSTGSRPTTRAGTRTPESSVTDSDAAPSTTWALVSTCPSLSMITPEPTTVSNRRCGLVLLIFIDWMDTTEGEMRSKSTASESVQGSAYAAPGRSRATTNASQGRMSPDDTPTGIIEAVMRRLSSVVLIVLLLTGASAVPAPAANGDRVLAATLDHGLRVLLLEDHRSPIVSFQVWYRVGSRNEARGLTGIAHFLEHLMFKGTPRFGPKQFARLVEQNGGQNNAFTTQDVTSYYVNIAADKIGLVIDLESDRMQNLLLDPREIDSEREVVIEERRTRTEDDPGGFLGEEVSSIAFKAHPYGCPIIGWMEDIKRITPAEIRAFYKTYYVPNNALLVAVGDFKPHEVLAKIRARFG